MSTDLERHYLALLLRIADRLDARAPLDADAAHLRRAHQVFTTACEMIDTAQSDGSKQAAATKTKETR